MSDGFATRSAPRPQLRVIAGGFAVPDERAAPDADAAEALHARLAEYQQKPIAPATLKTYEDCWLHFCAWCDANGRKSLPATAETVCHYLFEHRTANKIATLRKRVVAISQVHQTQKQPSPTADGDAVQRVLLQIRRRHGLPQRPKTALLTEDVLEMVDAMPRRETGPRVGELTALACRDRLLLLWGFAGGFRRSELVGIEVEHLRKTRAGIEVLLPRSKTDQVGTGERKLMPYGSGDPEHCPVNALRAWQELSLIETGRLFVHVDRHGVIRLGQPISDRAVALVVKRWAQAAGLDPEMYAGHSLRSGLATSAYLGGATETEIMDATGHKSVEMVRRYIQLGKSRQKNAARTAGL